MKHFLILVVLSCMATRITGQNKPESGGQNYFIENKGQIHNQMQQARNDILFSGTDGRMSYHFIPGGFEIMQCLLNKAPVREKLDPFLNEIGDPLQMTFYRVDYRWVNC